ncbi:MAG: YHS domain-containing protein [Calditrichaeota bacterium]|nr:YHS domain-containing protein [Calditrichota bacterium]
MKKQIIFIISLIMVLTAATLIFAATNDQNKKKAEPVEANVWTTDNGVKHFLCPVMKNEGVVKANTSFSIVDGKKYYHCCGGCAPKFQADPQKYLKDFVVPGNVIKVDEKGNKIFQCPVTGEESTVNEKTLFSDINGKRYYFCCAGCKPKFDENPETYLKKKEVKSSK